MIFSEEVSSAKRPKALSQWSNHEMTEQRELTLPSNSFASVAEKETSFFATLSNDDFKSVDMESLRVGADVVQSCSS